MKLTELGIISFPNVHDAQSCLGTHDLDLVLAVFMRIKPVDLFASLNHSIKQGALDVSFGTEVHSMPGSGGTLKTAAELPVSLDKHILPQAPVYVVESIEKELPIEVSSGMICIFDFVLELVSHVGVHASD